MALIDRVKDILDYVKDHSATIKHNRDLFDIYEGDLLKFIEQDLSRQLSPESYSQVRFRVAPINILTRVIDKLAKIYAKKPVRTVINGTEKDEELLDYYLEEMDFDQQMNVADELFNLHKNTTLEPFVDQGFPRLRVVPADRNIFMSIDPINPLRPTHWIKFVGKRKDIEGKEHDIFYIYTDDFFLPIDADGEIMRDILAQSENPLGINPYSKIPSVYINKSLHSLIPPIDTDTFKMTKILPIILSDLNAAAMFQSFSILYGVDVNSENLIMAPNAFWSFKSDPTTDRKPEIGVIKPDVDIDKVLNLIQSQLVLWLHSKNIRPGTVGTLNAENAASGISKIIDESDTVDARNSHVRFFEVAEKNFWDLVINNMHPVWRSTGQIETNLDWTPGVTIQTTFSEQLPFVRRRDLLDQVVIELAQGLTTKRRALKILNPEMMDDEIDQLLEEISVNDIIEIPQMEEQQSNEEDEDATEEGQKEENNQQ